MPSILHQVLTSFHDQRQLYQEGNAGILRAPHSPESFLGPGKGPGSELTASICEIDKVKLFFYIVTDNLPFVTLALVSVGTEMPGIWRIQLKGT